jgi:CRP-like cAMP-binding protein
MARINDEGFLELSGVHQQNGQYQLGGSNFSVLEGLSPVNLRVLNQSARVLHVAKGVEMIAVGDTPHDLYFIAQGSVVVAKKHETKPLGVATLTAGDFYGEYGLLRGKTRFASVYTAEPSVVIQVGLQAMQQVLDADEAFKDRLLAIMRKRVLNSFLFSHAVFTALSETMRQTLASQLVVSEFSRGDILFSQGDSADKYYMILSGEAEVLVQQPEHPLLLEIRRDNDILGEVRSDKGSKYAYTAVAANQLDLLVLDKKTMLAIQQADAGVFKRLQQFVIAQSKKTMVRIQAL